MRVAGNEALESCQLSLSLSLSLSFFLFLSLSLFLRRDPTRFVHGVCVSDVALPERGGFLIYIIWRKRRATIG